MSKMARKLGLIEDEPRLPWQEEGEGRVRYYTEDEETKLLGTLVLWGSHDEHDLCAFLIDTGCRLGEAEKLLWGDIRGRAVSFMFSKNKSHRTITATQRVLAVLARMKSRHPDLAGPFQWLNRVKLRWTWHKLRAQFEWMDENTVVHTFRHTCCSRLVIAGVDLMRVRKWMGHKRIETTMRYAHLGPQDLEALADVLGKYNAQPPLAVAYLNPLYIVAPEAARSL